MSLVDADRIPEHIEHRITLPDGRTLAAAEWGDPDGTPLIANHGTPGGRIGWYKDPDIYRKFGVRRITYDRPGYGDSTRHPGRRVVDAVSDIEHLTAALGIDRFLVGGGSGGGPHALACAALLPDRVLGTALIACVAPFEADGLSFLEGMGQENHEEFAAALAGEARLEAYLEPVRQEILRMSGAEVAAMFGELVDEVDRAAITGEYAAWLAEQMREGQRESSAGWVDDDISFTLPWGFDVESIQGRVHVWQGEHDRMVPFTHGTWLAAHLGNPCVHLHPEHGHMSLAAAGLPQILESLVAGT